MGKEKEPPGGASTRMNFLYQAAHLMSKNYSNIKLSNYYGKLLKEISKKMVEKLHPDLKRTMCFACNYSLTATNHQINVKVKPFQQKKKKLKKKILCDTYDHKCVKNKKCCNTNFSLYKYQKNRIDARSERPNKIWYSCSQCHFKKGYLQHPKYKIWIHKIEDLNATSKIHNND